MAVRFPRPPQPAFEQSDVFLAGDGYPTFRIPAVLTTSRGTVLAVAEGRQAQADHSQNVIVARRSLDDGRTWNALKVVVQDRPNVLVNPTLLEVAATGRVWLVYQRYPAGLHEREVVPGLEGDAICRSFLVFTDDDGLTWSAPREITRSVKRPSGATSIASGPGVGIQLRHGAYRGRLVVPFNEGPFGAWRVYAALSDDAGATWRYGETAPSAAAGHANEVQVVERGDGSILLNARNVGGHGCRLVAASADGGERWSPLEDDAALPDPECQASILRYSDVPPSGDRSRVLFANPAGEGRVNGTVRLSYDEGRSWPIARVVHAGSFGYSCLTRLGDGRIGLLYERDGYGAITFARFTLAWLTDGADRRL